MNRILKAGLLLFFTFYFSVFAFAQCSICTKTAEQLGEGPAKGLNSGIVYLMITPLALIAFIGYRWWRSERSVD
ncbi:MAG: hypothetical protein J0I09_09835 [Sphingobacteriia bacterium]|nr:hypothetical protein [Sphingobacteriia bacterium]